SALRTRLTRGLCSATASHARLITGMTSSHSPSIVVNTEVVSLGRPDSRTTRTDSATAPETGPSAEDETVGATEQAQRTGHPPSSSWPGGWSEHPGTCVCTDSLLHRPDESGTPGRSAPTSETPTPDPDCRGSPDDRAEGRPLPPPAG